MSIVIPYICTLFCIDQGEGSPVCYDVRNMDCTVYGIGASKFPLLQENLTIELLMSAVNVFPQIIKF
jgi:hypothetical protein